MVAVVRPRDEARSANARAKHSSECLRDPRPQIHPPTGDAPVTFAGSLTCLGCNLLLLPERCVEREGVVVCDQCPT